MCASDWEELQLGSPTQVLYGELQYEHPPGLLALTRVLGKIEDGVSLEDINHQVSLAYPKPVVRLCLFKLNMRVVDTLEAVLEVKKLRAAQSVKVGFFAAYKLSGKRDLMYRYSEILRSTSIDSHHMNLDCQGDESRLVEFGVYCEKSRVISQPLQLLRIERLVISPNYRPMGHKFSVQSVHATRRGEGPYAEKRLAWQWRGLNNEWPDWLAWSKTTGPFSYFKIFVEEREVGRSYCTEFPLRTGDIESSEATGESIQVRICGVLFGGEEVASLPVMIAQSDLVSAIE